MNDGTAPKKGLARAAATGAGAAALSRALRALVGIGTISLLSRFLSPTEFGLASLVFFIVSFTQILADFGLRVSLVQKQHINELETNSVFWASLLLGLLAALAVFAAAHPIARLFGDDALTPYVWMIAPLFVVIAIQGIPLALLERSFSFQRIATAELVSGIAGAVAAVGLAAAGASVVALIVQQYVIVIVTCSIYFVWARWRPRMQFSMEALRPLVGYGSYVTLAGLVSFVSLSADRPIVGKRLNAADLGYLTLAQQIIYSPIRTISTAIRRVTFPILSSLQAEPARIAAGYLTTLHASFTVMAPVCFGIWALAEPMTGILLGPKWGMVASVLGVLSVSALISTIGELNAAVFSAQGKARFQFHWSLFSAPTYITALYISSGFGLMTVVWARAGVVALLVPINCWFLARLLGIRFLDVPRAIWRPGLSAIVMGVATSALDAALARAGFANITRLLIGVLTGVLVYGGLIALIDRKECLSILNRVRRKS